MNEVTLDRLNRASRTVTLPDGVNVTVRALGDAERRQRNRSSLAASMRAERAFLDKDSDWYLSVIFPLENAERDDLEQAISDWRKIELVNEAEEKFPFEFLPIPDGATQSEEEETLRSRERSEKKTVESREKYAADTLEAFKKKISGWETDVLRKDAIERRKLLMASNEAWNESVYQTVFVATEIEGKPYFIDIADVRKLDPDVLSKLFEEQVLAESVNPWELTKFRP